MRIGHRITMAALNQAINADLVFNTLFGTIRKDYTTGSLFLNGGDDLIGFGRGGGVLVRGFQAAGDKFEIRTPNAACTGDVIALSVDGNADVPIINANSHRITSVLDPTVAQDALTHHTWAAWNPNLVWGGAAPANLTTVARWVKIGKTVYFDFYCLSIDSNACSSLTISLPVAPLNVAMRIACAAHEQYGVAGATYKPLSAYILADGADNLIHFWDFATATDGQAIGVSVSGFYEVA